MSEGQQDLHLIDASPPEIAARIILDMHATSDRPLAHNVTFGTTPEVLMDRCLNDVRGKSLVWDPDFDAIHRYDAVLHRWVPVSDRELGLHVMRYNARPYGRRDKHGGPAITRMTGGNHANVRDDINRLLRWDAFFSEKAPTFGLGSFVARLDHTKGSPWVEEPEPDDRCRLGITADGTDFPVDALVTAIRRVLDRPHATREENDAIFQTFLEAVGYWVTGNGPRAERGIILLGDLKGGNGKSWLLRLLKKCLPAEAILGLSGRLQFGQSHENVALVGKRLLLANELDQMKADDALKMLCAILSGDSLLAYRPQRGELPFSFEPQAGVIFSVNRLPTLNAPSSGGFARRFVILECDNRVKGSATERELAQAEAQVPGFLAMAIDAAQAAVLRGRPLDGTATSEALLAEWLMEGDPVGVWRNAELIEQDGGIVVTRKAYDHFVLWADANGYRQIPTLPVFSRSLRSHLERPCCVSRGSRGESVIKGVAFASEVPPEKPTLGVHATNQAPVSEGSTMLPSVARPRIN